jgi:hypothetical protein
MSGVRVWRTIGLHLVLVAAAACGQADSRPALAFESALMGRCYELQVGEWEPAVLPVADTLFHRPPRWFRLDTTRAESEGRLVEPDVILTLPSTMVHQVGRWHTEPPERLIVRWSDGFTGVLLDLRGTRDSLVGRARVLTDALRGSRTPEAHALARPRPCAIDS